MRTIRNHNGFTLVELLVALMVTSIVFTAVATLAYAVGTVEDSSDDTSRKQARVRYATVRISELIRHSKLVCAADENQVGFWAADENSDGQINDDERVYIDKVSTGDGYEQLRLREGIGEAVVLVDECSNIEFGFDEPSLPPTQRRFVSVSFDLFENGVDRQYQISSWLRGWAGHLLDSGGNIVSDDD